jgi:hypothetical protein
VQENSLNVLIYKRTHRGDPGTDGIFGIHDCMGRVRDRDYNAVIGVGGIRPWSGEEDIKCKVNWIGIAPTKHSSNNKRGSLVTFEKYLLLDEKGPSLQNFAPNLYKYMYVDAHRRLIMSASLPWVLQKEIRGILRLVKNSPPSRGSPILSGNLTACNNMCTCCR